MDNLNENISHEIVQNEETIDQDSQHAKTDENSTIQNHDDVRNKFQNLICFWIIGLSDGFGWTVMLSATFDIIKRLNGVSVRNRLH